MKKSSSKGAIHLQKYLRHRPRIRIAVTVLVVIVIWVISTLDHNGEFAFEGNDWDIYHNQQFAVVRVVDGDTLIVDQPDGDERHTKVRLWGVNTPELARPDLGKPAQPWAEQAKQYATKQAAGKTVRLELVYHRIRGNYGRILAYVHLPDGQVLNEQLILQGYSPADSRFSHDQLQRYDMLQDQAHRDRVGLWSKPRGK